MSAARKEESGRGICFDLSLRKRIHWRLGRQPSSFQAKNDKKVVNFIHVHVH